MMKTETIPHLRTRSAGKKRTAPGIRKILLNFFPKHSIILLPLAFMLGRASLAGGLMPFGIPVFAAASGYNVNKLVMAAFLILGMISSGAREQVLIFIAAIVLFELFCVYISNSGAALNVKYAIAGVVSVLIPETVSISLKGFLLYDILKALFHGVIVFTLVFVFRNAEALFGGTRKKLRLSNEEVVSISIIVAIALLGLSNVHFAGFGLKNITCILVILISSYKCGAGAGAAIGVTIGLIISMSNPSTPLVIGFYGFCGLISGVLRGLGKFGPVLGFFLGNTIMSLYLNNSTDVLISMKEVIAASIIFLITPKKLTDTFTEGLNGSTGAYGAYGASGAYSVYGENKNYNTWIKTATAEKLNKFSGAFRELARIFGEISETRASANKNDISVLFDRVADRVCKSCSLCLHCWDRNFYDTYQIMFKIVEKMDKKGRIDENDIPGYFLDRCERINDFVKAINNIYEIFKVDMVWKSRMAESREIVSKQMESLSEVISGLAVEIGSDIHFKDDIEELASQELSKLGFKLLGIAVIENKKRKYEMKITCKGCGGKRKCITSIARTMSGVTGRRMVKESGECGHDAENSICTFKLVEEEAFGVITGIAGISKSAGENSGDCYTFMNTGDGRYVAALSDGMGSGSKAAAQSRAAVSLLEQFIDSGFDKDNTVKLINSMLTIKSNDESFATIDLAVLDLYEGNTEFLKIGAAPTYIKKPGRIEVIRTISLPAGIVGDIEAELIQKKVENGDFIIMMTDGLFDSFNGKADNGVMADPGSERTAMKTGLEVAPKTGAEAALKTSPEIGLKEEDDLLRVFVQQLDNMNPQAIAEDILTRAIENCGETPGDDMTVLVAKVWKKTS